MTKRGPYNLYLYTNAFYPDGIRRTGRGRCIFTTNTWTKLKAEAERRAIAAGYPKSRWPDLFDWNEGASR